MTNDLSYLHRRELAQIIAASNNKGLSIGGYGQRRSAPQPEAAPDYTRPNVEIHADFGAEGYLTELTDAPVGRPQPYAADGGRYLEIIYGGDD
jgi:hypothetical protein